MQLFRPLEESLSRCISILDKTFKFLKKKIYRGHTDLNHGPIGLQPIALPLSYIPNSVHQTSNLSTLVEFQGHICLQTILYCSLGKIPLQYVASVV